LALQEFIPEFCAVYIDDYQIFSSSFEEHMVHFEKVLDRMIEVNMKLLPDKCVLFRDRLEFLGFEVSIQNRFNLLLDWRNTMNRYFKTKEFQKRLREEQDDGPEH
jgi:hypothetical protein